MVEFKGTHRTKVNANHQKHPKRYWGLSKRLTSVGIFLFCWGSTVFGLVTFRGMTFEEALRSSVIFLPIMIAIVVIIIFDLIRVWKN